MRLKTVVTIALALGFLVPRAWSQSVNVAARTNANLLVCSWNIKWFRDTGRDLAKLARVIAKFDLCGIIELQSDRVLGGLAAALEQETGERWTYIQTDRTGKEASYIEQFAFIWRDAKVRIASGHVGNVADFPRTHRHQPYIAAFRSGNFDFRFLLIHTRWTTAAERAAEVAEIARNFHWFQYVTTERDVVVAGDFNYPPVSSKMAPLTGMADVVNLVPAGTRTTLKLSGQGFASWYDHIFVQRQFTQEATGQGGAYDFVAGLGYTDTQEARGEISDHLPVWAEFRIDGLDDD